MIISVYLNEVNTRMWISSFHFGGDFLAVDLIVNEYSIDVLGFVYRDSIDVDGLVWMEILAGVDLPYFVYFGFNISIANR